MARVLIFFASLIAFMEPSAFAARQTVACAYSIHTVTNAEIRYDHYYENPIEMSATSVDSAHGTETFADGSWLTVDTQASGAQFKVRARFHHGDQVFRDLQGVAPFQAHHAYRLSRTGVVSDTSTELQFADFEVICRTK